MNTLFNKVFGGCNMKLLNDPEYMRRRKKRKLMAKAYKLATKDELPEHLRIWLDADWTDCRNDEEKKPQRTLKDLKEIREKLKRHAILISSNRDKHNREDHSLDAMRYSMHLPRVPKKQSAIAKLAEKMHIRGMLEFVFKIIKWQKPKFRSKKHG